MTDKKNEKADKKVEPPKEVELSTLAEVAKLLKMPPLQLKKLAQTKQVPAVKVDGEWRFNKDLVYQAVKKKSRGR